MEDATNGNKPANELEHAVMGIKGSIFEATMSLLHDLSGHFRGERYTIVIEVEPDWVYVRKIPRE
jgi:hypothetical protein